MKSDNKELNGKYVNLTPDIEADEELLGKERAEQYKRFRKKNPNADLSVYKIKVNKD